MSKSQVSRLCGEIDERVDAFLSRPLEGDWPYLWLDATYIKASKGGVRAFLRTIGSHTLTVSVAAIVAVGVNTDRRREVIGASIQRCRVHFMRNALACVGKRDKPIVTAALRTAFDQDTLAASKEHWAKLPLGTLLRTALPGDGSMPSRPATLSSPS